MAIIVEIISIIIFYGVPNIKHLVLFIGTQATVFQFWTPDSLRGYGCGTPNGSLWTIGVLIQFYLIVWFLRKLLHGKKCAVWMIAFVISIALGMVQTVFSAVVPEIVLKLYGQTVLNHGYLFLADIFLAEYKEKLIPILQKYWVLFTAAAIVFYETGIDIPYTNYSIIKGVLCVYGLIGFAYAYPKLNIRTDISYGLYIYHMTVVNIMITLGMTGKIEFLFLAIAISVFLAWCSTKTIGAWAAKKKIH